MQSSEASMAPPAQTAPAIDAGPSPSTLLDTGAILGPAGPDPVIMDPKLLDQLGLGYAQHLVQEGGPIVALLLIMSVFVFAIITVKLWQFLWIGVNRRVEADRALRIWLKGDHQRAIEIVSNSRNPVSLVMAHGMRGLMKQLDNQALVREDVERVAQEQISSVRSFLRAIEAVAQTAPLMGLFGTVLGMIQAFTALKSAGAEADPAVLAGGISVALLTTAVGLAVAIPAALVLHWFEGSVERLTDHIESAMTGLFTGQLTEEETASIEADGSHTTPKTTNAPPYPDGPQQAATAHHAD